MAHAHGEIADGVVNLLAVLEDDDSVGLADSDETRVCLPWNLVAVSVGLNQGDAALADRDTTSHGAKAMKDL